MHIVSTLKNFFAGSQSDRLKEEIIQYVDSGNYRWVSSPDSAVDSFITGGGIRVELRLGDASRAEMNVSVNGQAVGKKEDFDQDFIGHLSIRLFEKPERNFVPEWPKMAHLSLQSADGKSVPVRVKINRDAYEGLVEAQERCASQHFHLTSYQPSAAEIYWPNGEKGVCEVEASKGVLLRASHEGKTWYGKFSVSDADLVRPSKRLDTKNQGMRVA